MRDFLPRSPIPSGWSRRLTVDAVDEIAERYRTELAARPHSEKYSALMGLYVVKHMLMGERKMKAKPIVLERVATE